MAIGSIGSSTSFWQQDQSYWSEAQAQGAASSADDSLIDVMGQAETNLAKGLAGIANGTALKRVNSQLTAAIQSLLQPAGSSTPSSSSTGTSSSSGSSSSVSSVGAPAVGTGTVVLTTGTSLATLGILQGGTITISAGNNATTYTSTGTDTIGNLINAINIDLPTNAQVVASVNSSGKLVLTSRNESDTIAVVGSGTDASAIGFGIKNNSFEPTAPSSNPATASSASSTSSSSSSAGSSASSSSKSSSKPTNAAPALQSFTTAASILSASGAGGTLVDMLA
jgi:hypothetical protein